MTCLSSAQKLLEHFVSNFPVLYGNDQVSYNVHNLLHIVECIKQFGAADKLSAYRFENFMQHLSKKNRKPSQILQQLYKRLEEEEQSLSLSDRTLKINVKKFDEFILNFDNKADCFCSISPDIPIKIVAFGTNDIIIGRRCLNVTEFFIEPLNSKQLGIIMYGKISEIPEEFNLKSVELNPSTLT